MEQEPLNLNNQLCFRIYAASRKITGLYRDLLQKLDLTYPQYLVMMVLWEQEQISVNNLGAKLYLDSGTLTPLLKRLEQKGLLERKRSTEDERSVISAITAKGKNLRLEAMEVPSKLNTRTGISPEEYLQLKQLLDRVITKIS